MTSKAEVDGDLAAMFSDWDEANWTPQGFAHPSNRTKSIEGIFNSQFVDEDNRASTAPNFRCKEKDVDGITRGATLEIVDGDKFTVQELESDNIGTIILWLEAT